LLAICFALQSLNKTAKRLAIETKQQQIQADTDRDRQRQTKQKTVKLIIFKHLNPPSIPASNTASKFMLSAILFNLVTGNETICQTKNADMCPFSTFFPNFLGDYPPCPAGN